MQEIIKRPLLKGLFIITLLLLRRIKHRKNFSSFVFSNNMCKLTKYSYKIFKIFKNFSLLQKSPNKS